MKKFKQRHGIILLECLLEYHCFVNKHSDLNVNYIRKGSLWIVTFQGRYIVIGKKYK